LEEATGAIRSDASICKRVSQAEYDRQIADRDREWNDDEPELAAKFEKM